MRIQPLKFLTSWILFKLCIGNNFSGIYLFIKYLLDTSSILLKLLGVRNWGGGNIVEVTYSLVSIVSHGSIVLEPSTVDHKDSPDTLSLSLDPLLHNTVITGFQRPWKV